MYLYIFVYKFCLYIPRTMPYIRFRMMLSTRWPLLLLLLLSIYQRYIPMTTLICDGEAAKVECRRRKARRWRWSLGVSGWLALQSGTGYCTSIISNTRITDNFSKAFEWGSGELHSEPRPSIEQQGGGYSEPPVGSEIRKLDEQGGYQISKGVQPLNPPPPPPPR